MDKNTLLFLDFDGVICDSIDETIVSSWLAYYKYLVKKIPVFMYCDYKQRFMQLRPFIRSGEDYLVIQDIIANNMDIKNQKQFDRLLTLRGEKVLQNYKDVFYQARTEIFTNHNKLWLSLNTLYPHMHEVVAKSTSGDNVYILSMKKSEFISQILQAHNLKFSPTRIIYAGQEEKLSIISRMLELKKKQYAILIDDQISHFVPNPDSRIKTFLADWGYIKQAWLKQKNIEIISANQMAELMARLQV